MKKEKENKENKDTKEPRERENRNKGGNGGNRRRGENESGNGYVDQAVEFYNDNRRAVNIAGIVAVSSLAIYAIAKWVPVREYISRIQDKIDENFGEYVDVDAYFEDEDETDTRSRSGKSKSRSFEEEMI